MVLDDGGEGSYGGGHSYFDGSAVDVWRRFPPSKLLLY